MLFDRSTRLFMVLGGFFVANVLIAELLGVKIFAFEETLGFAPLDWRLFGQSGSLNFTVGVLLWPIVFIMTDIINEYFGWRGVRFLSYLAVGLILYTFAFAYLAIKLVPAGWWIGIQADQGVPDMQAAFATIFGQGMWSIAGSVLAFLVGQLIDVAIFQRIRRVTGERYIWVRATGSTLASQLIDSFLVLYVAFVIGPQHWPVERFLAVGTVNYVYKFIVAIALIPLIYFGRFLIRRYLGTESARTLAERAASVSP